MMIKNKQIKGKDIDKVVAKFEKNNIKIEDTLIYLFAFMNKNKSANMALDISNEKGKTQSLIVFIANGSLKDNLEMAQKIEKDDGPNTTIRGVT